MARSLYIHWPFCLKKCPYCDFNSHVRASVDQRAWRQGLLTDMRHEAALASDGPLTSIFFGGGTPSLMPPGTVAALLEEAERLWGLAPNVEITLEANPSSVEAQRFADLAAAGVNRVSLGVQALDDAALKFLGRLHGVDEALQALNVAQAQFERVSFDLIYARPGQTLAQWRTELTRAIALGTGHLSLYHLTIEAGTRFATDYRLGRLRMPDDDTQADLFAVTREVTAAAGLPAYEVSNHARPGEESRHNLAYWRYDDYLGIGPGAHGRRGGFATVRHKKPENWLGAIAASHHGIAEQRPLTASEAVGEALMMGLRLGEGVDLNALERRFGTAALEVLDQSRLDRLGQLGLISHQAGRIRLTDAGAPLLDAVLAELLTTSALAA
ncbi:radical SAM family heme chaperone HemW [Porphyrobacter sp. GA68]|uniref:radical SAM family heme chaperone HemW n=1 Tax=Porphyrobacter sp. GA68 TaxID=2883480 RepID=UPI001D1825B6|nr:radical SAM family heme chaperone HemW [Porphyrobacter sp. GA68]